MYLHAYSKASQDEHIKNIHYPLQMCVLTKAVEKP